MNTNGSSTSNANATCLGLFAKYWEPGKVKTRLAATLGEVRAAQVYQIFLETLVWRFGSTAADSPTRRVLTETVDEIINVIAYAPENRSTEFRKLSATSSEPADWEFQPQGHGDLGARLHRFFAQRFQSGNSKVMVIGTDSPTLPTSYITQAFWLLNGHDVVLGPTEDGGYYLVAARNQVPPIFTEIQWSTDRVWPQTVAALQERRVKFAVLPTWYDVDNADDLHRLRAELAEGLTESSESSHNNDRFTIATRLDSDLRVLLDRES